jgi:hypothetical protein
LTYGVLAAVAAAAPASDDVTPGVLGFLVVAAMGVALFFLVRSMNKQFRKIAPQAGEAKEPARATRAKPGQAGTPTQEPPE